MIVVQISRDAVCVATRGYVLQPLPRTRVDHTEDGGGDHVSRRQVILTIARVKPPLIRAAYEVDRGEDGACSAIHDVRERSKLPSIMPRARHHHICARTDHDTAWLAVGHREAVDHCRYAVGWPTREGVEGIDFVDATNSDVAGDRVRVGVDAE